MEVFRHRLLRQVIDILRSSKQKEAMEWISAVFLNLSQIVFVQASFDNCTRTPEAVAGVGVVVEVSDVSVVDVEVDVDTAVDVDVDAEVVDVLSFPGSTSNTNTGR